jgi:hypothetical protein
VNFVLPYLILEEIKLASLMFLAVLCSVHSIFAAVAILFVLIDV